MEKIELKVTVRKTVGDGAAKELRREGLIPAILYGPKAEPVMLSVMTKELETILVTSNIGQVLLNLLIQNGKQQSRTAMIKELQTQPISGNLLHVDFYEVAMDQKIKISIPVVTTGQAAGVEEGGVLQLVRHEVEIFCFPNNIPESLEVDVTDMNIGDSKHIDAVSIDESFELADESNFTLVTVLSPKAEEEEEVEEVEEGEEGEETEAETAEGEEEPGSAE
ncbi:MAG: 50S ribosomal protein L25/general stress protein Ctc [Desulfobacterales bacterium]|nr:50S ribosomal protein L25/general stress protein Ctc [Desulfobacterales bacterium]MDX2511902.1 50S ribosomal protein L25/general stress protein Ctc [Desulfobacterales bacterium]